MASNRAFMAVLLSWLLAQFIKFLLAKLTHGDFFMGRAFKTGGMPSAHSALVSALTFSAGVQYGTGSIEFLIALVLTLVVSYDAMGMRAEINRHGRAIRELAAKVGGSADFDAKYPGIGDFQGHELVEVVAGLALGIVVSALVLKL